MLALGRTRRLVSKALRRALMIRDMMCRYPGCHQIRHLDAHHVIPWIRGGRTDLENLILLVGGITLRSMRAGSGSLVTVRVGCLPNRMGSRVIGGSMSRIWPATWTLRCAGEGIHTLGRAPGSLSSMAIWRSS